MGRLDEARRLAEHAVRLSNPDHWIAGYTQQLLGDIATHPDQFNAEAGEFQYRKALAISEPRGLRPLAAHCHLGLGKLYQRTGKLDQAGEHLTIAMTMYREMDMRSYLEKAEAAI